jgi:hypothetical protein
MGNLRNNTHRNLTKNKTAYTPKTTKLSIQQQCALMHTLLSPSLGKPIAGGHLQFMQCNLSGSGHSGDTAEHEHNNSNSTGDRMIKADNWCLFNVKLYYY